jgi:hypothetical protein
VDEPVYVVLRNGFGNPLGALNMNILKGEVPLTVSASSSLI